MALALARNTLFFHRKTPAYMFDPNKAEATVDNLFDIRTEMQTGGWAVNPFKVGVGKLPKELIKRDDNLKKNSYETTHSFVITASEKLVMALGEKMHVWIETSVPDPMQKGEGVHMPHRELVALRDYHPEHYQSSRVVGMAIRLSDQELTQKERAVLLDNMVVFKEIQNDPMSEDSVFAFEAVHLGKTATSIIRRELKAEDRLSELTLIETKLASLGRFDELTTSLDLRPAAKK